MSQYTGTLVDDMQKITEAIVKPMRLPEGVYPVFSRQGLYLVLFPKRAMREAAAKAARRFDTAKR